ncbi:MAG: RNA polymerase sigma-70 factor [Odoribacteraceae bacterium]|nr:RNA polymerase sigma-70 factor [Odoribacteraceae bacterium]
MALREGDHKAYETIFVCYFPRIKYYIKGLLKSGGIAEELTQEVFARLWENHASVKPSVKSLTSFLFTIAYRVTIDSLRSKQVRESYYNEQVNQPGESASAEEDYMARETSRLVELLVERMPARQREIYKMSRHLGLSNEEIAARLAISKRTVENQLSLALNKIKGALF